MTLQVPFFRPDIGDAEVDEVVEAIRSGWLTTGPRVKTFEARFAEAVGAPHAIALNSCTAALHLAVEALGLGAGDAVLIPTMTFAATAEVVRYTAAFPVLVDCDPETLNLDLEDASRKLESLRTGRLAAAIPGGARVVGIIPVHVGGLMLDVDRLQAFAERNDLWVVEDAAHAFPAAWRRSSREPWQRCGDGTAAISCFSFYANKTITTGEGGMVTTADPELADRMRIMSLHGLSGDAWRRYSGGSWDYRILAPGFKYNMTDVAAALGIHQLRRAEEMREARLAVSQRFLEGLADVEELELPLVGDDRLHSWHLFPVRLRLERLTIDRNAFMEELKRRGVGCSVHWRPLHLHPYYEETFRWRPADFPVSTSVWERLVSLPIYPGMTGAEIEGVVATVKDVCRASRVAGAVTAQESVR